MDVVKVSVTMMLSRKVVPVFVISMQKVTGDPGGGGGGFLRPGHSPL
jgi:hypothetical protein